MLHLLKACNVTASLQPASSPSITFGSPWHGAYWWDRRRLLLVASLPYTFTQGLETRVSAQGLLLLVNEALGEERGYETHKTGPAHSWCKAAGLHCNLQS